MSKQTKVFGILGVSLFVLGVAFVCLHLVRHSGVIEPLGLAGLFLQFVGAGAIIGTLIRLAIGR